MWLSPDGFVFPGFKSSIESNLHPRMPDEARVEELQEVTEYYMSQENRSILGDLKEDDCVSMWNSILWSTAQANYLGIHLNLQLVYIRDQLTQALLCLVMQTVL